MGFLQAKEIKKQVASIEERLRFSVDGEMNGVNAFSKYFMNKSDEVKKNVKYWKKELYNWFKPWVRGAFISMNPDFKQVVIKGQICGMDMHQAYVWALTQAMPTGEVLNEKPSFPAYRFIKVRTKGFAIKKKFVFLPPLMSRKGDLIANYYVNFFQGEFELNCLEEEFDFYKTIYNFVEPEIVEEFWFKKTYYLEKSTKEMWEDYQKFPEAKRAILSAIGTFHINPNKGATRGYTRYCPVFAVVTAIVRMRVMTAIIDISMVKGNIWLYSATDSLYWLGKYHKDYSFSNELGSWDTAFKKSQVKKFGNYADKMYIHSLGCYGIEKKGNKMKVCSGLIKSEVKDISVKISNLLHDTPVEKWHLLPILRENIITILSNDKHITLEKLIQSM